VAALSWSALEGNSVQFVLAKVNPPEFVHAQEMAKPDMQPMCNSGRQNDTCLRVLRMKQKILGSLLKRCIRIWRCSGLVAPSSRT